MLRRILGASDRGDVRAAPSSSRANLGADGRRPNYFSPRDARPIVEGCGQDRRSISGRSCRTFPLRSACGPLPCFECTVNLLLASRSARRSGPADAVGALRVAMVIFSARQLAFGSMLAPSYASVGCASVVSGAGLIDGADRSSASRTPTATATASMVDARTSAPERNSASLRR